MATVILSGIGFEGRHGASAAERRTTELLEESLFERLFNDLRKRETRDGIRRTVTLADESWDLDDHHVVELADLDGDGLEELVGLVDDDGRGSSRPSRRWPNI